VIAIETNILVYAHRREPEFHPQAAQLLAHLAEGHQPWAIPWPCIFEFFSVATNPRIWNAAASTPDQATNQIEAWLSSPSVRTLSEPRGFFSILEATLRNGRMRGGIVHDARVAALCLAHGVEELLTRDRDFRLIPQLKTRDPFAAR